MQGVDEQGNSYEDMLCPKNLTARGIGVIGDSAMAHFHIPEQWVDADMFTWVGELCIPNVQLQLTLRYHIAGVICPSSICTGE
jgi:hypothetical protein